MDAGGRGGGRPRSRAAGVARAAGRALAVVALLALAAVAGAFAWLHTDSGARWLGAKVLSRVDAALEGRITARAFRVHGFAWDAIGLELRDPGGKRVATADRVEDLPLAPLARGRLAIDGARLVNVRIDATLAPDGLDLARAVARRPRPGERQGGRSTFEVNDLAVRGGTLRLEQRRYPGAAAAVEVALQDGWIGKVGAERSTSVHLTGTARAPVAGPFRADLRLAPAPARDRRFAVALGGAELDLAVTGAGASTTYALSRLLLLPDAAAALWPAWPLHVPLALSGEVRRDGPALAAEARGTLGGAALGPLHADARLAPGRVELRRLEGVVLGGARVDARGAEGGGAPAEGAATVSIPSLAQLSRALRAAGGPDLGGLEGAGRVEARLARGGAIELTFAATRLRRGSVDAERVRLAARARAGGTRVRARLSAARVRIGDRTLHAPEVAARRDGDRLALVARAAEGRGRAAARLRPAAHAVDLEALELRTASRSLPLPGVRAPSSSLPLPRVSGGEGRGEGATRDVRWSLAARSRLSVRGGGFHLSELALRSGDGAEVAVRGGASARTIDLRVRAAGVPLGWVAALAGVPARGTLSGVLAARGDRRDPRLALHATVRGGAIGRATGIALDVDAAGRARGTVRARIRATAAGARVSGALAAAPAAGGARRVEGRASLSASAAALARLAGRPGRVGGAVSAELQVSGPLRDLRADAAARVSGLSARGSPGLDGTARAALEGGVARAELALHARTGGDLTGTATLRRAGAGAPPGDAALDAHLAMRALDAAALAALAPGVDRASGRIDGTLDVEGTPHAPRTRARLDWRDGALATTWYGRYDQVRASLELAPDRLRAELRAGSGGGTFALDLDGVPSLERATLHGTARLERFPIVAEGQLRARTTATVTLDGEGGPAGAHGLARIRDALVALPEAAGPNVQPLPLPEGIVVIRPDGSREGAPHRPTPEAPRVIRRSGTPDYTVEIAAARPIVVSGPSVQLHVEVVPGFRIAWHEQLLVFGALRVPTGELDAAGAQLAVLGKTELRFDGPPAAPFVTLAPAGTLGSPEVRVHARRPGGGVGPGTTRASELQLYSMLASGKARPASEPPRPLVHSSVEGAGWGSALVRAFASNVPVGAFLSRGVPGRSQDIRTSVTGRVEIGSFTRLSADPERGENRQTVTFGLRLAPRLRLETRFGDGGTGALDVYWVGGRTSPEPR